MDARAAETTLRVPFLLRLLAQGSAWIVMGCSSAPSNSPPVFGGEGAQLPPAATPMPENAEALLAAGPCAQPAPASDVRLLDDFEDGDNKPFRAFQREAWWFAADDSSAGKIFPPPDRFEAVPLPPEEATTKNRRAAHFTAEGFSDWGVVWGTTLRWIDDGIRCPFNAERFVGLRFRAKGNGRVRVNFGIPETTPPEYDGVCQERCFDTHSQVLTLTPEWQVYEVRWDRLQQGGWGSEARFDPQRLLTLNFNVQPEWMPVDVWVDDLEFFAAGEEAPERPLLASPPEGNALADDAAPQP